ncbi:hypothetical protein EHRUM1_03840 [Ehrlichia ruminantium]|nr:hypothetical protein EHRUM1_03840 [Ehrlichia ruminantium]
MLNIELNIIIFWLFDDVIVNIIEMIFSPSKLADSPMNPICEHIDFFENVIFCCRWLFIIFKL